MKKITLIFSLMVAMFTTAMAQTNVDLTTGTFDGEYGLKESMSQWTSTEGIKFVTTDANGNELGVMKVYNKEFRFNVNSLDFDGNPTIAMPIGITITAPEGYILKEITFKKVGDYNQVVEYYGTPCNLDEEPITLDETVANFTFNGNAGRYIILKSLTVVRDGNAEGGETEGGETEGEGNENQGGNEGEIEGGDNQGGNEGEGEGNEEEGEDIIDRGEGNENQGGNEGETEGEGNENQGGNEGETEGEGNENQGGNEGSEDIEGGKEEGDNEGEEASIDEVTVETAKVIYDLTGRRVNEITKAGIYIVNGKKVVIK